MKRPWYAEGLRFECARCGACCTGEPGYVWVTEAELHGLAAARGLPPEGFRERYLREAGARLTIREKPNGDCEMFEGKECSAYDVRPAQCRSFPFWPENLRSRKAWTEAARSCPGVNRGRLHAFEEIEETLRCSSLA